MQYTITINQLAVINANLDLDVVDLAIFDFVKHYAHTEKCMKLQTESGTYYWISHMVIIQELPILGISTGAGIVKRINKLIDAGLLSRHPNCDLMRKTFYKFGPNYDKICFTSPNESLQPTTTVEGTPNESLGISPNDCCRNQSINNHSTTEQVSNNNNLFPEQGIVITSSAKKRGGPKPKVSFEETEYNNNPQLFCQRLAETGEFPANVNYMHYYYSAIDWSAKGNKYAEWIAGVRNWIRSDMQNNKLPLIKNGGTALSPDAIEYLQSMAD